MAGYVAEVKQTLAPISQHQNGHYGRLVKPVHTQVRGRVRLHVDSLLQSDEMKVFIETELPERIDVERVTANPLTGNVLVTFDPRLNAKEVIVSLENVVRRRNGTRRSTAQVLRPLARNGKYSDAVRSLKPLGQNGGGPVTSLATLRGQSWHLLSAEHVLTTLQSSQPGGLSIETAKARLKEHGPNSLGQAERRSAIKIFLDQFKSLPVSLLMASSALSVLTGGLADAAVIMAVVLINAGIGLVTEYQAEKTILALTEDAGRTVTVIRDKAIHQVRIEQIVPGDILVLTPGDQIAADARLLEVRSLTVNEAALTGESLPVSKSAARIGRQGATLGDRVNMVYRGTVVTGGSGLAVTVATGKSTEVGRIQSLMNDTEQNPTPLQTQLQRLGNQMVSLSGATCGLVFLIGLLRGHGFLQMLKTAVSLAVAAVPEGLPTVSTTTLSLGIREMRRRHVLIRKLDAVESLGAIEVLCLDKTGTLTEGRMLVQSMFTGMRRITLVGDEFYGPEGLINPYANDELLRLIHIGVLCNEVEVDGEQRSFVLNGSATEIALMRMAISAGVAIKALRQQYEKLRVDYRANNRNYMSVLLRPEQSGRLLTVKGNPAEVLSLCRWYIKDGEQHELTDEVRTVILRENERIAGEALRVLGFAYRSAVAGDIPNSELTWVGLAGMVDPVRDGTRELITLLHQAGIKTVMITGDQSATAYAIGKSLGLSGNSHLEMIDSTRLEKLDPQQLTVLAQNVDIFARVSPAHKLQIVRLLQGGGKVVAMTGDGINDGPALKAAEVGIARGSNGTVAARSVADVVLENDDLQTLVVAVGQGRTIYNNIRKSVHFLLSTNLSEIMVTLSSIGAGLGQPLNAMQLLWINLLTDVFPALALSVEPVEPDLLLRPPRDPQAPIVSMADLKRYGQESLTVSAATMASYGLAVSRYGIGPQSSTIAFMNLTMAQLLHAYSCRSENRIFGGQRLPANPYLNLAVGGSVGLQLLSVLSPALRGLLGTAPLGLVDWLTVTGGAILPFVVNEATKKAAPTTVKPDSSEALVHVPKETL